MKISVVVPAFNEEKLISETLGHINHSSKVFDELGWETEVIVCNNNSSDATGTLASQAGARVVFESVNQIGRARNAGAAAASGDWLIFIDADSHPSRELFGEVAAAIQSRRYLAGGCIVRLDRYGSISRIIVGVWNCLSRVAHLMAGSFIFCERPAFEAVGGFNLELYASEEIDLSRKLKRLARQQRKKVIILHRHPLLTSSRKMRLYTAREYVRFLVSNFFSLGRNLKSAEHCFPWYDGRR